jgi:hypothetical protein
MSGTFSEQQVEFLLRPLNAARIEKRQQAGMTLSYINQADMRAHAIRLFGFGNFDIETLDTRLMFEDQNEQKRWNVGYLVTAQVTIRNERGEQVCRYSESAVGQSTQPQRGEAHDMALKSATSDAMKRCFINIGDQGGLGLYNNGSTAAFVKDTLVKPSGQSLAAPVADEDTPSAPVDDTEALAILTQILDVQEIPDPGKRILEIAGLKSKHGAALDAVVTVSGRTITLAYAADRVAAGLEV